MPSSSYATRAPAAMPIDVERYDARTRVDERTYHLLEDLWRSAIRRAEEAIGAATAASPTTTQQQQHSADAQAATVSSQAPEALVPHVDATRLSSAPRSGVMGMASSPLPRAPHKERQQQVVLRRPVTGSRMPWMKVDAQPNLKRNGYTSHKGVAWVVK